MSSTPHFDALAASAGTSLAISASPEAERSLLAFVEDARATHPSIHVDALAFVAHVGVHLPPSDSLEASLARLCASDLYLAHACLASDPAAHRSFETLARRPVRQLVARSGTALEADDFWQQLHEHIMLPRVDRGPRLGDYSGKGALVNWIRVTAQRLLVDEARKRRPPIDSVGDEPEGSVARGDPELELLEASFRHAFRAAFARAFEGLTSRERLLLRYRFVDGLGVNQIASITGMHRVSASRALGNARRRLLEAVRGDLVGRMRMRASEADSMMRLMRSRIEISLGRLLATVPDAPEGP